MKIVTVVGARPQFIKYAAVSRQLRRVATEALLNTVLCEADNISGLLFLSLETPQQVYGRSLVVAPEDRSRELHGFCRDSSLRNI